MCNAKPQEEKLHLHPGAECRCGTLAKELGLVLVSICRSYQREATLLHSPPVMQNPV